MKNLLFLEGQIQLQVEEPYLRQVFALHPTISTVPSLELYSSRQEKEDLQMLSQRFQRMNFNDIQAQRSVRRRGDILGFLKVAPPNAPGRYNVGIRQCLTPNTITW